MIRIQTLKSICFFFKTNINRNDLFPDEVEFVMVKKFGENLLRGPSVWYPLLLKNYINLFNMLANSFIRANVGAKKFHP